MLENYFVIPFLFCLNSVICSVFAWGQALVQVWGRDVDVKYVHKASLITWIRLFWKIYCLFNMCFRVNRENTKKLINRHKRCILEVLTWIWPGNFVSKPPRAVAKINSTSIFFFVFSLFYYLYYLFLLLFLLSLIFSSSSLSPSSSL